MRICSAYAERGTEPLLRKTAIRYPQSLTPCKEGNIEEQMMYNTYNMGLGMVLAVDPADVDKTMEAIRSTGDTPYVVGSIEARRKGSNLMLKSWSSCIRRRNESSGNHGCY